MGYYQFYILLERSIQNKFYEMEDKLDGELTDMLNAYSRQYKN